MGKDVVHINNRLLLSHKKRSGIGPFVAMWMNLEPIIQSEVRKRKTNIVC